MLQLRPKLPSLSCSGREDSGSLLVWQDNLSGRGPIKSSTCLKQTLGEIVMPQPKRPITKSLFMCLSLWVPGHHLYPNFYYDTCPEMQPPCQTEQLHAFFPPKTAATVTTLISTHTGLRNSLEAGTLALEISHHFNSLLS